MSFLHCKTCGAAFHPRHGSCVKCYQTSLNTPSTSPEPLPRTLGQIGNIPSRPVLGVSLSERTTAATNIASDLPEGKEEHVDGVYPKTPTMAESAEITQRIAAAIGRDDHCLDCDEPLITLFGVMSGRCMTCTAVRCMPAPDWVQTTCVQCGEPMVVDIDSFQITCNRCEESNNAN